MQKNIPTKIRLAVLFVAFLKVVSCSNHCMEKPALKPIVPGKYTLVNLSKSEKQALIKQYGDHFKVGFEMVLDLKSDSTFRVGYCDRKVSYRGKWRVENDSVILYDKFYGKDGNKPKGARISLYYTKYGQIFMPFGCADGYDITVLAIGGELFDGILEGDEGYEKLIQK
ncbi:MAG: hypothetical protein KF882_06970 [Bacteroidia bacterium]|nr:hypothetical protein [Bacteroidia bacterium]MCO5254449.1 hypothetical protein [Bacteroidota bacterium]